MNPLGMAQHKILESLNPAQRQAVTHGTGPQLIIAGAGTGKTAVITRRIAHLVASKACSAREIMALTFTDKAAEEMESRVDLLVPYGFTDSTICTFHALGDRLLREQGALLGMNPNYRLLSASDQLIFLREHLFELPLDCLRPLADPTRHLQLLVSVISRAKDEDVDPATYLRYCEQLESRLGDADDADRAAWQKQQEIARVYAKYQELLLKNSLLDFGDLITQTLRLLREHPDVLADYRKRFRFILVDEFQDTNAAQFELIRLLAGDHGNVTVVGDDDQSIYKFRGAAISNILQFTQHYPDAAIQVLTENYRSGQFILDAAYRLIRHNDPDRLEIKHGLDKRLVAVQGDGSPVIYRHFDTVSAEADWVAAHIEARHRDRGGGAWSDFCLLIRANRQADPFIRALNMRGIPFRFSGNQGLYQRPEIRLCTAFLRLLADPSAPLPFHEIAASALYDLSAEDLAALSAEVRRRNLPLREVVKRAVRGEGIPLSVSGRQNAERLLEDIGYYLDLTRRLPSGQVLYHFLTRSGLLASYTGADTPDGDRAIKNLARFFTVLQRYEHIARSDRIVHFVQHLDMLEDSGNEPDAGALEPDVDGVHILTVHRSKGLEFPVVFLPGLAANRFPPIHRTSALEFPADLAKETLPGGDASLAEERRLFYVAMTRAREELIVTSARDYGGSRFYKISRFVMEALELPQDEVQSWSASALEQIHRHAPVPEMNLPPIASLGPDEPLSLSYYQIDDFLTCPLKYKYVHLLKIPVLPHHAILYGSALHAAVNEFYRRQAAGVPIHEDDIIQAFLNAWINEGYISREHEELRQNTGIQALKQFVNKESLNNIKPKYIEKSFSFNLECNRVVGRIDRVDVLKDGRVIIVDFKSSDVSDPKQADKKAKESLQLKIYSAAWRSIEGCLPARVDLYFLNSGIIGSWEPSPEKIDETEELIKKVASGIRTQQFPAQPDSWKCGYCAYKIICPKAVT